MTVNESLGFGLLVGQNKQFKDVTFKTFYFFFCLSLFVTINLKLGVAALKQTYSSTSWVAVQSKRDFSFVVVIHQTIKYFTSIKCNDMF